MQNLFIGENEKIVIKFSVATNKNKESKEIYCDISEDSLKESLIELNKNVEDYTIGNYSIKFKKISFGDIINIYKKVNDADNELEVKYNKIVELILEWDLRGEKEKPDENDIRKLHPVVASCISIQLESETGGLL